ncbi:hypothetical protein ERJ75_000489900 [Trypanosoma vivax]|nr:hypothetical protein TRVL_08329 [Trypanosoma vivax]KAH8616339.1 hypothetical protein ERJ75_000489900 [Trypanosoma vivax]
MLLLRTSGATQLDVLCEDGWRALLEAEKRATVTESMNTAVDMVLDAGVEENRIYCNQAGRVARLVARGETMGASGNSCAQFRQAGDSAGKRDDNAQSAECVHKQHCRHKSAEPRPAPRGFGFGSEPRRQWNVDGTSFETQNVHNETPQRIYKGGWPGDVGRTRATFIVSVKLARSSAVQYTRTLLLPMAAERVPAQVFLLCLRRAEA